MSFPPEFQILVLALLAALGWSAVMPVLAWSGVDARPALQLAQLPASNAEPSGGGGDGLSRGVARLAAALALISAAGWMLCAVAVEPRVRTGIALLTYLALVAALVLPRRALCRPVRMQLAGLLGRIVKPSMSDPVHLADIIMADILTSCSRMLADATAVACQFGALLWSGMHSCTSSGVAGVLLASAPFAFRLRQCVNEYLKAPAGSADARRHLANAIKYASSFPVIVLAAAQSQAAAAAADLGWAPQAVRSLWVVASAANSLYSLYWDVAFDWDLGHTPSGWKLADLIMPAECTVRYGPQDPAMQSRSFPRFLRPRLRFASHSVYYVAIAVDLVLRMAWTLKLGRIGGVDSVAYGGFWLSALELYRRWQWSILRIEKEDAAV